MFIILEFFMCIIEVLIIMVSEITCKSTCFLYTNVNVSLHVNVNVNSHVTIHVIAHENMRANAHGEYTCK